MCSGRAPTVTDDGRQTLVLAATQDRLPQVVYRGAPLPMTEHLGTLRTAQVIDVTDGMLDANPDLSICPEASRSFPGQPGLILRNADGAPVLPGFRFDSASEHDGRHLIYTDAATGM